MKEILGQYIHEQSTPSSTWLLQHNLKLTEPVVDCYIDDNGNLVKILPVSVVATSDSLCTITFTDPQTGKAFLI